MTDFSVRMIPIADLRDHPRNSNRHGDRQLEVLATRWRALGWYKNVVVAEWEGTTTLLAGHGIVAGARAAGATEAPCHVRNIDPLSPEALDILEGDNTVADLAEPDLHERLRNLVELDAAGRLGNVGFDDGALDRLKAELQAEQPKPPVEDPGPSEPPTEPVTKLGDVWLCGQHRVVCGDCTEAGVWDAVAQGRKVNVVFTSPPYGAGFDYGDRSTDGRRENAALANGVAASLWAVMADNGRVALQLENFIVHEGTKERGFCALPWQLAMLEIGFAPMDFCIWDKGASGSTAWGSYMSASCPKLTGQCEGIYVFVKGDRHRDGPREWQNGDEFQEAARNVWRVGTASNTEHPAVFPVKLVERALRFWSFTADIVADPFLGSGTTLIAAEQLGRVCYGVEIEPRYVDVAVRRWQQATGQTAILESTGQPFPDVT